MKPNHSIKTAGLLACTFLATAGFIPAQEATAPRIPADLEARREAALKKAEQIREMLVKHARPDTNQNGWDDRWERKHPGHIADKAGDPDGDGINNWQEMLDGTNPARPNAKGIIELTPEEKAARAAREEQRAQRHERDKTARRLAVAPILRSAIEPGELSTAEEKQAVENEQAALRALALKSAREQAAKDLALDEIARRHGTSKEIIRQDGSKAILSGEVGGVPAYIGGHSYFGAAGISADEVWPTYWTYVPLDTGTGYNVSGLGQTLGMWETDGGVRTTHQEFSARVTQKDSAAVDGNGHASQVAGTMAGGGAFSLWGSGWEPLTRGVAYEASVFAYNTNDFKPERESAAAGNTIDPPLRASNHSWGFLNGWSFEDVDPTVGVNNQWVWWGSVTASEEPKFGLYLGNQGAENGCTQLDKFMASEAPRHLLVYSCGNDRGEGPGASPGTYYVNIGGTYYSVSAGTYPHVWADGDDGGYDTVSAPGTAKNVLTVGACEDVFRTQGSLRLLGYGAGANATPASFSGFGPTDDGRLKPDLVAVGVGNSSLRTYFLGAAFDLITPTYSAAAPSNSDYTHTRGTSFSAPSVTGGLALLLQHRKNLYPGLTTSDDWRNSTLKAIAIETCDDVGSEGPDYQMGHGIFNVRKCCDLLYLDKAGGRNSRIKELVLAPNESISWYVTANGGPLSATAAWSDPEGVAPSISVDPTNAVLVNDINLKIEHVQPASNEKVYPPPSSSLTTYHPWVLNPDLAGKAAAARSSAATRGVDNRNNVERISVNAPTAGLYRVTLTHAGGLPGGPAPSAQTVSVAMSGGTTPSRAAVLDLFESTNLYPAINAKVYTMVYEADPDAYFTVQVSTDLMTWTDVSTVHGSATATINAVDVPVPLSASTTERHFWRLKRY